MDRGAWQATVHGVTESDMTEHIHILYSDANIFICIKIFTCFCFPIFIGMSHLLHTSHTVYFNLRKRVSLSSKEFIL